MLPYIVLVEADNSLALSNASHSESVKDASTGRTKNSTSSSGVSEENLLLSANSSEAIATAAMHIGETEVGQARATSGPALSRFTASMCGNDSNSPSTLDVEDVGGGDTIQMYNDGPYTGG